MVRLGLLEQGVVVMVLGWVVLSVCWWLPVVVWVQLPQRRETVGREKGFYVGRLLGSERKVRELAVPPE